MARPPSQAAHIRLTDASLGARGAGGGEKPDDWQVVPLCAACHTDSPEAEHQVGTKAFWRVRGLDPLVIAAALAAAPSFAEMEMIVLRVRIVGMEALQ